MINDEEPDFEESDSLYFTALDKANIELLEIGETMEGENGNFKVDFTSKVERPYTLFSNKKGIFVFANIYELLDYLEEN
jgi:hypothetical protein